MFKKVIQYCFAKAKCVHAFPVVNVSNVLVQLRVCADVSLLNKFKKLNKKQVDLIIIPANNLDPKHYIGQIIKEFTRTGRW
ncbi:MAG: hypothetical protein PHQ98_03615 [Candidatus ainarchaeum sp.]|nr:hypothetical protein [Candidatus ainarchaeum sp.]